MHHTICHDHTKNDDISLHTLTHTLTQPHVFSQSLIYLSVKLNNFSINIWFTCLLQLIVLPNRILNEIAFDKIKWKLYI